MSDGIQVEFGYGAHEPPDVRFVYKDPESPS